MRSNTVMSLINWGLHIVADSIANAFWHSLLDEKKHNEYRNLHVIKCSENILNPYLIYNYIVFLWHQPSRLLFSYVLIHHIQYFPGLPTGLGGWGNLSFLPKAARPQPIIAESSNWASNPGPYDYQADAQAACYCLPPCCYTLFDALHSIIIIWFEGQDSWGTPVRSSVYSLSASSLDLIIACRSLVSSERI